MLVVFFFSVVFYCFLFFFFSSRRRHTRCLSDWSSDLCSSDLAGSSRGGKGGRANFQRHPGVVERRALEPFGRIAILRPVQPEPPERGAEAKDSFASVVLEQGGEGGANARQLSLKAAERRRAQIAHAGQ